MQEKEDERQSTFYNNITQDERAVLLKTSLSQLLKEPNVKEENGSSCNDDNDETQSLRGRIEVFVSNGSLERALTLLKETVAATTADNNNDDDDEMANNDKDENDINDDDDHHHQATIVELALHSLATVSVGASDALKNDRLLPATSDVHRCMESPFLSNPRIQEHACLFLRQLSNPLLQELVAAGSLSRIVRAMQHHPTSPRIQECGNATLYNLLPVCPKKVLHKEIIFNGMIPTILEGMRRSGIEGTEEEHLSSLQVLKYGFLVWTRLIKQEKRQEQSVLNYQEHIVSKGGLDILFSTISSFSNSNDNNPEEEEAELELAQITCTLWQHCSRLLSLDIQRMMVAKDGIPLLFTSIMRNGKFMASVDIQDPAMATVRNLCVYNPNVVFESGGIPTILVLMTHFYPKDAAIQAYGCDALGRMAMGIGAINGEKTNNKNNNNIKIKEAIYSEQGVVAAVDAMKYHAHHSGVKDRAIFLLSQLIEYPPALAQLQAIDGIVPFLQNTKVATSKRKQLDALLKCVKGTNKTKQQPGWFFQRKYVQ